jgi:MFS transporter, DHA1 family, tetracycline resistance protein
VSQRKPAIMFALIAMALDASSVGLIIPVAPQLVTLLAHHNTQMASRGLSIMMALFAVAQLFAAPILGGLSDRFGRRRVILISFAGMAADFALTALAPTLSWLFIARTIAGLTASSVVTVNAYIADVTPPEQRAQRFGLVGAAMGGAFVLGPAVGGLLGQINVRLPFWVAAGLCGANLVYGLLVLPESLPPERRRAFDWRRANPFASAKLLLSSSDFKRLGTGWFLTWFGMGAFPVAFLLSNTLRFGWNSAQNGVAIAVFGVAQALVQAFVSRRMVAAVGEARTAQIGYACTATSAVILGLATHGWMIWAASAISGFGSLTMPAIRAMVSGRAAANRQGEAQGALSAVEGVAAIVSPLVAGEIFARFSTHNGIYLPGAPFLVTAVVAFTAVWIMRGIKNPRVRG